MLKYPCVQHTEADIQFEDRYIAYLLAEAPQSLERDQLAAAVTRRHESFVRLQTTIEKLSKPTPVLKVESTTPTNLMSRMTCGKFRQHSHDGRVLEFAMEEFKMAYVFSSEPLISSRRSILVVQKTRP